MTMFARSPQTDLLPMELPELTSLPAGSRARTLATLGLKPGWTKEPDQGCGQKSPDLLASYDLTSSSWKTSQHCFLALPTSQGHGLGEFLATWPNSGSMRSGKIYQHQSLALRTVENVFGLLPTPNARDGKDLSRTSAFLAARERHSPSLSTEALAAGVAWQSVAPLYEAAMGFPWQWTDAE
jgi:hypothetical protein